MLWNSEGTSQPRGPHDQAKPAVKRHSKARMAPAGPLGMLPVVLLKDAPMTAATTTKQMNIWMPPSRNRALRPSLQCKAGVELSASATKIQGRLRVHW